MWQRICFEFQSQAHCLKMEMTFGTTALGQLPPSASPLFYQGTLGRFFFIVCFATESLEISLFHAIKAFPIAQLVHEMCTNWLSIQTQHRQSQLKIASCHPQLGLFLHNSLHQDLTYSLTASNLEANVSFSSSFHPRQGTKSGSTLYFLRR